VNARRPLAVATLGCAAGAALILLAAGQPWARVVVDLPGPLPPSTHSVTGRELSPLAGALGLAGLAGLAGILATSGTSRRVVGVLLSVFGIAVSVASVLAIREENVFRVVATKAVLVRGVDETLTLTPWWVVGLLGGVLMWVAGWFVAVRGGAWARMPRRYDAPSGTSPPEPRGSGSEQSSEPQSSASEEMWDLLDRGHDPTAR
jgi:uncharacterized membrane protein (TIGR02234 family)